MMIPPKTKAQAIASLKMGKSVEEVAELFDIPKKLVHTWYDDLDPNDLVGLEANVIALKNAITEIEVLEQSQEEQLKFKLEKAAIEIADNAYKAAGMGDAIHSKSIQLLADAVSKMYTTIILKGNTGSGQSPSIPIPNANGISVFENLLAD